MSSFSSLIGKSKSAINRDMTLAKANGNRNPCPRNQNCDEEELEQSHGQLESSKEQTSKVAERSELDISLDPNRSKLVPDKTLVVAHGTSRPSTPDNQEEEEDDDDDNDNECSSVAQQHDATAAAISIRATDTLTSLFAHVNKGKSHRQTHPRVHTQTQ